MLVLIDAVHLKDVLGGIQTNSDNRHGTAVAPICPDYRPANRRHLNDGRFRLWRRFCRRRRFDRRDALDSLIRCTLRINPLKPLYRTDQVGSRAGRGVRCRRRGAKGRAVVRSSGGARAGEPASSRSPGMRRRDDLMLRMPPGSVWTVALARKLALLVRRPRVVCSIAEGQGWVRYHAGG